MRSFVFGHPLKQGPTGGKKGEDGNAKICISREGKWFFR